MIQSWAAIGRMFETGRKRQLMTIFQVSVKTIGGAFVLAVALTYLSCDDTDTDTNGGGDNCEDIGLSQPLSAPCCSSLGVDACGAGLFCDAFDGRTQTTCYAERSRTDMTECNADVQCVSGSCNLDEHACRSLPEQACTSAIGCSDVETGMHYVCNGEQCVYSDGGIGDPCNSQEDCVDSVCENSICLGDQGAPCSPWSSSPVCRSGLCCQSTIPDYYFCVTCS
jgi:hypothetical protein